MRTSYDRFRAYSFLLVIIKKTFSSTSKKINKLSITLISSHVIMKPAQSKPFFFFYKSLKDQFTYDVN